MAGYLVSTFIHLSPSYFIVKMIYHGMKADLAYLKVEVAQPPSYTGFRDAAMGPSTYDLHIHDVLRGLEQVRKKRRDAI